MSVAQSHSSRAILNKMLPYIRWPSWFPYFEDEIFYSRSVSSSPLQRCLIKAFTGHYILTLTRMFLSLHRAVPVRNYWISYHQRLTSVFSVGDHTPLVFWTSASLFIPLAVLLHLYIQLLGYIPKKICKYQTLMRIWSNNRSQAPLVARHYGSLFATVMVVSYRIKCRISTHPEVSLLGSTVFKICIHTKTGTQSNFMHNHQNLKTTNMASN